MRQAVLSRIADKSHRAADRKDYYRLPPRVWGESTAAKLRSLCAWKAHVELYRRSAPAPDPAVAARLEEMADFFTFLEERFSTLMEDYGTWRKEREAGDNGHSCDRGQ